MNAAVRKINRTIGLTAALIVTVCMGALTALHASAAIAEDRLTRYAVGDINATEALLIVIIIILVIALIGAGVVIFVVLNKKKDAPVQPPVSTPVYPSHAKQTPHNPPYAPYEAPAPQMDHATPAQQQDDVYYPEAESVPRAYDPVANGGMNTTGFSPGSVGFILLRKNGGDKVRINKEEFIIGKEKAKVDYCISNNNSVSRRHAQIKVRAGKCYITDLGSTNSTYINGTKLNPNQEVALIPGDKVRFSNEEFEFIG